MNKRILLLSLLTLSLTSCGILSPSTSSSIDSGNSNTTSLSNSTSTSESESNSVSPDPSESDLSTPISISTSHQSYYVSFVTNCSQSLDTIYTYIIETSPSLINGDYALEGWYLEANFTNIVNFPFMVTSDVTLYAKWAIGSSGFSFATSTYGNGYACKTYSGNLTSIVIPGSYKGLPVIEVGDYLFKNNAAITNVTLPQSIEKISLASFKNCTKLTSIIIPNNVKEISTDAFAGCEGLTSLSIGASLSLIGNNAFEHCSNLASLILPSTLKEIKARSFADCSKLTSFTINATIPPIRFDSTFENNNSNLKFYVDAAALNAYKTSSYWLDYASLIYAK